MKEEFKMNIIKELIQECRELKKELGIKNKELTRMKNAIRLFMIDSGIPEIDGVKIRRGFSAFDLELLRLEKHDLFERYAIREEHTIVTFENVITKEKLKLLQKEHPELWNDQDYRKEKTPGLYGL